MKQYYEKSILKSKKLKGVGLILVKCNSLIIWKDGRIIRKIKLF